MSASQWIFFDVGWTLVDESRAHRARFERLRAFHPQFAGLSDADFTRLCQKEAADFAPSAFFAALERLDPDGFERTRRVVPYDHSLEELYPGVPTLLESLSRSFKLGLIANQSAGTTDRLRRFGIDECFSLVLASAEMGLSKPDPRIFARAQELAGCRSEETAMVGDRVDNDIGPANSAGWQTYRVRQGFSRTQEPRGELEVPDHDVASVSDLLSVVN